MPVHVEIEQNNLVVFHVSGVIKKAELDRAQAECERVIRKAGRIKILALPDAKFKGWEHGADWGDLSFALRNDRHIEKIAIVGTPAWRDLVNAFVGKGLRPEPIRYFDLGEEAAARLWLNTPGAM